MPEVSARTLAISLFLAGCFEAPALPEASVGAEDLPGAYTASYADVQQWLVLRADGTYEQLLLARDAEPMAHAGSWRVASDGKKVNLEDPVVLPSDPARKEVPRQIKGTWSLGCFRSIATGRVGLRVSVNWDVAFERVDWDDVPAAIRR